MRSLPLNVPLPEKLRFTPGGRVDGDFFDCEILPRRLNVPSDQASAPREVIVARLIQSERKGDVKARAAAAAATAAAAFSCEPCRSSVDQGTEL